MTDLMQQETRCTARRKNGEPCRNWAIHGSNVCRMHGGAAPQVRRAAQVRALMSSDRLMAQLIQIAEDQTQSAKDRLAAIVAVLDRAGIGTRQQTQRARLVILDRRIDNVMQIEKVKAKLRDTGVF